MKKMEYEKPWLHATMFTGLDVITTSDNEGGCSGDDLIAGNCPTTPSDPTAVDPSVTPTV